MESRASYTVREEVIVKMENKKCPLCSNPFNSLSEKEPNKFTCIRGHLFTLRFKEGMIGKQELVVEANPDNLQDKGKRFDCD